MNTSDHFIRFAHYETMVIALHGYSVSQLDKRMNIHPINLHAYSGFFAAYHIGM